MRLQHRPLTSTVPGARGAGPAKVMLVFGTRPEAVKVAPVAAVMARQADLLPVIVVTAQHRAMLDQVLEVFKLTPDYDLNIIQPGQTLADVTARAVAGLDRVMAEVKPVAVLVQGDTTSTLAGALSAFYQRVPVAHLEAGLRTGQRYSPYPEEMNRRLTSELATLHLAATPSAKANLLAEGVAASEVVVTGNTVVDAVMWALQEHRSLSHPALVDLGPDRGQGPPVLLVTAHRRESWGAPLVEVGRALADIARARPDVVVVVPLHLNPVVREAICPEVAGLPNVRVTEPLTYPDFALMMRRAELILSDSGGVQEEAPTAGVPVLVMRDSTERSEALEAGTARLVGTSRGRVRTEVLRLLADHAARDAMLTAGNPFGDGKAAPRAVEALRHIVFGAERPTDFVPLPRAQHLVPFPGAQQGDAGVAASTARGSAAAGRQAELSAF